MDDEYNCKKILRFLTRKEGKKFIKDSIHDKSKNHLQLTSTYLCKQCDYWHVTSMKKDKSRNFGRFLNKKKP